MEHKGPRSLDPRDGIDWLRQATRLMMGRPMLFLIAAMLAPLSTMVLLRLPFWDVPIPGIGPWMAIIGTAISYGLPLTLATALSCAIARAVDREKPPRVRDLMHKDALTILVRPTLFLFALLLQGFLALSLVDGVINPATVAGQIDDLGAGPNPRFGLATTLLGTQLGFSGGLLLVMQLLVAFFIVPLHLFRELPLNVSWRLSFKALQLNPWLGPSLGLPGMVLMLIYQVEFLAYPVQVLALPLPAFYGSVLYVAWREVFQNRDEEEVEVRYRAVA